MKQNDKITRRRNQHTVASRLNDIDLSSLYGIQSISLTCCKEEEIQKLNFYSCPTARDRSLGMRVYLCVYIHT